MLICPYRLGDRPVGVRQAVDRVGNDLAADGLHINRGSAIDSRRAERLARAPIIVYSIRFTLPKLPTLP